MVKWLVEQGHTVFMVSWVNPDTRHGGETWEDYMFEGASRRHRQGAGGDRAEEPEPRLLLRRRHDGRAR